MKFEDLLQDFGSDFVNNQHFILNALLAALLAYLLGRFYIRYGTTITNRKKFASIFMLLALSTMLIIFIVKSSIALSLGLVGALSIVRFRAAIKEPEELVYLFFVIGIGLGMGANQPTITILAFVLIISLLTIRTFLEKKTLFSPPENMVLNISTPNLDVHKINEMLAKYFSMVELKRLDQNKGTLFLSYVVETDSMDKIVNAKDELISHSPDFDFSFVEQRNLAQ